MKIIITADLHFGISAYHDKKTLQFIRNLSSLMPADVLLICGDAAETVHLSTRDIGFNHRRLFSEIKKLPVNEIAFCAGSHDIWTSARYPCLLYTSPSPRDRTRSRMPSSA